MSEEHLRPTITEWAAAQERKAIVAWLRENGGYYRKSGWRAGWLCFLRTWRPNFLFYGLSRNAIGWSVDSLADLIEAGHHITHKER